MAILPDNPDLRFGDVIAGSRTFVLQEPLYHSHGLVPTGFVTDGASVPRIFWNLFPPSGSYFPAAIVHDWHYAHSTKTRKECDQLFRGNMKLCGCRWYTRAIIYRAVRLGGWITWRKHRRDLTSKTTLP